MNKQKIDKKTNWLYYNLQLSKILQVNRHLIIAHKAYYWYSHY